MAARKQATRAAHARTRPRHPQARYGERLDLDYAIYTCFANAEYHARQRDQAGERDQARRPDQPATSTTAPQDVPWRPTVTEVDIIAAICKR